MTDIKMTQEEIEALRKEMINLAYSDNGQEQEEIIEKIFEVLNTYDPKTHYDLIFENLTRDICELYIENDRSISPILEPLLVDLSRISRLAIRAMNVTVIRWYLRLKGRDEVVELLETNVGKEWMERNLQEIKDFALSKDEDELEVQE
jgi:predicted RecB family nuclease